MKSTEGFRKFLLDPTIVAAMHSYVDKDLTPTLIDKMIDTIDDRYQADKEIEALIGPIAGPENPNVGTW